MCKYSNGLLLIAITTSISLVCGLPVLSYDDDYDSGENDYDVIFDQRQNGTENVRLSVDGIVIAVPAPPSQADLTALAGSTLLHILGSHMASLDADSSEEEVSTSTTTTSTTTTTTAAPLLFEDQFIPVNLLGQGLSFLFNKGVEVPIKIASGLKPLRAGKPDYILMGEEDKENDAQDAMDTVSGGHKSSKHKRRYKLKVANALKPLLRKTYVV
ncbi:uncharacterized protein LOC129779186 [Toxorhynchites rutilus septentrionalis]|uniref:uncharacterized protein LOC129779186 n=1 Tax=Toxorhynchites rutilus septentrionalis TaxID=329112 RepID=UPI00247B14F4|nr:uncharacterized protein LOC129779186 [Toxorhynchites rutilus septentrionalis]